MNRLYVGTKFHIELPKGGFLFIHDEVPRMPLAQVFDPLKHSLDPLRKITKRQARELADVLYALSPQGENTITVRNGKRALAPALFEAKRFDLIKGDEEVQGMIDDLLFIPEIRSVLCGDNTTFSLRPHTKIFARLNRSELGEFTCLVIGLVLMNMFKGQLIIPDLTFYGRPIHTNLVREERLIAGVQYLGDLPLPLRRAVLSIKDKQGYGCLFEDAETLAKYAGLQYGTTGFSDYVAQSVS
jgi:hypothetical protein